MPLKSSVHNGFRGWEISSDCGVMISPLKPAERTFLQKPIFNTPTAFQANKSQPSTSDTMNSWKEDVGAASVQHISCSIIVHIT